MKYILDTTVLINHSELLARRAPDIQLVVPEAAVAELRLIGKTNRGVRTVLPVIDAALRYGTATIASWRNEVLPGEPTAIPGVQNDFSILALVLASTLRGEDVALVTDDVELFHRARDHHFAALTSSELIAQLASAKEIAEVAGAATEARRGYRRNIALNLAISIAAGVTTNVIYSNIGVIVATAPVWASAIALFVAGAAFFWVRQRYRLGYGLAEYFAGFLVAFNVLRPGVGHTTLSLSVILQLLGGVYVMVRGLDNVGKGIAGTRAAQSWSRVFGAP